MTGPRRFGGGRESDTRDGVLERLRARARAVKLAARGREKVACGGDHAMLTRRFFTTCALCSIGGFAATEIVDAAPAPAQGIKRKILQQTDGPVDGFATILFEAEVAAGATVAWHTHPGIESTYVVEGGGELMVRGKPDRKVGGGDGIQIAVAVPHAFKNGDKVTKLGGTYVVEKGKPLSSPASPN